MTAIIIAGFILFIFLVYRFGTLVSGELLHYFYPEPNQPSMTPEALERMQNLFFKTVFMLLGHIAKIDGHIEKVEINLTETYMEKMALSKEHKIEAIKLFKLGAKPEFDAALALEDFKTIAQSNPNMTEILLVYMVNLARIDGLMVDQELKVLRNVAAHLGYESILFDHMLRMMASQNRFSDPPLENYSQHYNQSNSEGKNENPTNQSESKNNNDEKSYHEKNYKKDYEHQNNDIFAAYEALGVLPNASDADVKKAYRRLISQHHPDKLIGRGLPDFMIKAATEHIKKIQAAYDYVKQFRGNQK